MSEATEVPRPYLYNRDHRAMPETHLRVVVERDHGEFDFVAYVWGWELDISCLANDPAEAVENLLCSLESLGYEGKVEVDDYELTRTIRLGKTEHFKEMFPEQIA